MTAQFASKRMELTRHRVFSVAAALSMACLGAFSGAFCSQLNAADLASIQQSITAGNWKSAADGARELDDSPQLSDDLTRPLAILAHEYQKSGDDDLASEFYSRSLRASQREQAADLDPSLVTSLHLAGATHFLKVGQIPEAIDALSVVLSAKECAESHRKAAIQLLLRIGSAQLVQRNTKDASLAYELAVSHASDTERSTAMLGAAWAAALNPKDPTKAARLLAAFVDAFPEHNDAPAAMRACASCLKQAGREEDSDMVLGDLLVRWPDSVPANEVVASHANLPVDKISPPVRKWLMTQANENPEQLRGDVMKAAIRVAADEHATAVWDKLTMQMAAHDETGQMTADFLQGLCDSGQDAEAERFAAAIIVPSVARPTAASREAACRWAGRTQRWTMLALASESCKPDVEEESRTVSVERLFAESLMQTGRPQDARRWWVHLVDQRHTSDFATLLRCAETSVALADVEEAARRVQAASKATDGDTFRDSLVKMLAADLAIRRLRFDDARGELESVVRAADSGNDLRGRAQWLIGETHYLQQKFPEAIEAYRQVEGIAPESAWAAAALLQAGKSFEQLGRTRDALVCYSSLVSRFADSQHASTARRRLADISPSDTIRR